MITYGLHACESILDWNHRLVQITASDSADARGRVWLEFNVDHSRGPYGRVMKWPDNNGYTSLEPTPNGQLNLPKPLHAVHSIYREPGSGAGLLELTTRPEPNGDYSAHANTSNSTANPMTAPPMT